MPRFRHAVYLASTAVCALLAIVLIVVMPLDIVRLLGAGVAGKTGPVQTVCGLIIAAMMLYLLVRGLVTQAMAVREAQHLWDGRRPAPTRFPVVSILIPAYREGQTIEAALHSIMRLDYPEFEVVLVDDGSTDDTLARARAFAAQHPRMRLRIFTKPNGGKWSALNQAFLCCSADLILCVDADSRLDPDALAWLVDRMERSGADGICGQVSVRNRDRPITLLQAAEYLGANASARMAQSLFGQVLVVPGPIGLYRRAVLEAVLRSMGPDEWKPGPGSCFGPLSARTFAEDFHLSLTVLALGHRIVFEPRAIARTQAPATMIALINQRYRWSRGTIQVLRIYFQEMRARHMCKASKLDFWIILGILPDLLIFPLINMAIVFSLPVILATLGGSTDALRYLALTAGWGAMSLASAIAVQNDQPRMWLVFPFIGIYQGGVLNLTTIVSCIDELRGARMRWS